VENEITKPQKLLDKNGALTTTGWARDLLLQYDRDDVKAPKRRIKEWESYLLVSDGCALQLSIANLGYVGLVSATLVDFRQSLQHTKTIKKVLPLGAMALPYSSKYGDATYTEKRVGMNFSKASAKRYLKTEMLNFLDGKNLYVNVELEENKQHTLVCALPFTKENDCFHYSQKTIYPHISGIVRCGGEEYSFQSTNTFGLMNWGRSVWPRSISWNSACLNGSVSGEPISFYVSDGPTDSEQTSECVCYYRGRLHKLGKVCFSRSNADWGSAWNLSTKGMSLTFEPAIPYRRSASMGLGSHQSILLFGLFSGAVTVEQNKTITIRSLAGFIESTQNTNW
jgi:hypothetical protein